MAIVASVIIEDHAQRDGRRCVRERHRDHMGGIYFFDYLAEAGADTASPLAAHAAQLVADLATAEIDTNEQRAFDQQSPAFNYSTAAQFRQRIRQRFQTLSGWDAVRLGKFLQGLGLSDAQLAVLFGVSNPSAQLTALKTRLSTLAAHYDMTIADSGQ